jgi:hypothetical protein
MPDVLSVEIWRVSGRNILDKLVGKLIDVTNSIQDPMEGVSKAKFRNWRACSRSSTTTTLLRGLIKSIVSRSQQRMDSSALRECFWRIASICKGCINPRLTYPNNVDGCPLVGRDSRCERGR